MTAHRRGLGPWRTALAGAALLIPVGGVAAGVWAYARPDQAAPVRVSLSSPVAQTSPVTARQPTPGCERCHGELELLRQQTGSLSRAQEVLVSIDVIGHSAHSDKTCADCHSGYARYPHVERLTVTQSCASCHAPADSLWTLGAHASADDPVLCRECHDSHAVSAVDTAQVSSHAAALNAPCVACHAAVQLPVHEPHADGVSCARCHAPHDTRTVDDPDGWLAPARQAQTCGACHDEVSSAWGTDIHGDAALRAGHLDGREPAADVVSCTSCHIGHEMLPLESEAFAVTSVERCAACHEHASRTFYNSYHGRATALGSRVSASCADCHGAHDILPTSMSASHVAPDNLVETCSACHENARPAFVLYDSHPDPFNRHRNPWIFYSFWMMNGLLIFVLVVFGGHTLLWWLRLWLDKRRGIIHGIGVHGHDDHEGGH
jgi:predicted CXXCH cytochrome family protein